MGNPSPPFINSRYASGLVYPQTAEMMLAGVARTPPDVNRCLVLEDGTWVFIVGVVRHNTVEFRVQDGRHGCHDDRREWGEVPLYFATPSINRILGDAEA